MQAIAAAMGLIGCNRGPRDAGTGYNKLYHSMGMVTGKRGAWAYVRGAMGSVTQALKRVALKRGVEIRTDADVAEINISNGRANGVTLVSGEVIDAGIVVSNADPKRTYLKLVPNGQLPAEYQRAIEGIKIESPVMKINLATSELPKYWMLKDDEQRQGSSGGLFVAPSIDYMQHAYNESREGRPAKAPFMSIHMQSAVDSTVAPEGKHTISIFAQYFPYTLAEGTWDERRDEIADYAIAEFAKYSARTFPAQFCTSRCSARPTSKPASASPAVTSSRAIRCLSKHSTCARSPDHLPTKAPSVASSSAAPAPGRAAASWARPATTPPTKSWRGLKLDRASVVSDIAS